MKSPIVLFAYNRINHIQQVIKALLRNEYASDSDLIIYSDASKNDNTVQEVQCVRQYLSTVSGFKSVKVIERLENFGLAKNIIDGVTSVINQYGKVIVLEDDLVVSPYFLKYMNEALDFYEKEEQVISIHGYIYPVKQKLPETFFIKGADCWGWATWKRGWDLFCSDGKYLLKEIEKQAAKRDLEMPVLIQVNIAKEESKHGFEVEEIDEVFNCLKDYPHVKVRGLMMMAPHIESSETEKYFKMTQELLQRLQKDYPMYQLDQLSMGMSNDYHEALNHGSTLIRIGSALFK